MEEIDQTSGMTGTIPAKPRKRLPILVFAVLLLLAVAYAALCIAVSVTGHILPRVSVGDTSLGGLTAQQAASLLSDEAQARLDTCEVSIHYGEDGLLVIPGRYAAADARSAAEAAYAVGRDVPPALYGVSFLKALTSPTQLELPVIWTGEEAVYAMMDEAFAPLEQQVVPSSWTVEEAAILLTRGQTGWQYDRENTAALALDALTRAARTGESSSCTVQPVRLEPEEPDWQAIADQVFVAPADAGVNTDTREVIPSVVGVSLDTDAARQRFAAVREGEHVSVPLTFTQPAITTDLIFRDRLGEVKTYISGVANRVSNVSLAASMCHNILLLPGDEFSYWNTIGPCSASQGFLPASSYVNGQTVDSVGGGVCQVSSSIYYAALKANLEIVERQNHSYAVGYVPDGADATVYSGYPDFRFKNNTDYPIRISATVSGRNLTVRLEGTKTDDTYVKMEFKELSRTQPETVYKADASIPAGTTKVSVTPYTGRKVEAYRCVYRGDGTLLSRTLESVNNYKKRDQVILCHPDELYLYDPSVPAPTPSVQPSQEPTPAPSAEPVPGGSPVPSDSPAPSQTSAPAESPAPTESAAPSQAPAPSAPAESAPTAAPEGTTAETEA